MCRAVKKTICFHGEDERRPRALASLGRRLQLVVRDEAPEDDGERRSGCQGDGRCRMLHADNVEEKKKKK